MGLLFRHCHELVRFRFQLNAEVAAGRSEQATSSMYSRTAVLLQMHRGVAADRAHIANAEYARGGVATEVRIDELRTAWREAAVGEVQRQVDVAVDESR